MDLVALKQKGRLQLFVALVGIFLLPFGLEQSVGLGAANFILLWPFWSYISSYYFTGFALAGAEEILGLLPFWIIRFLLVFGVSKHYDGSWSRMQLFIAAIISEIPPLILSLPTIVNIFAGGASVFTIIWPFPILLLLVMLIVFLLPPSGSKTPWSE